MVNNVTPNAPAVGACHRCRQLFLVTDSSSACQFCGRPPDLLLPFGRFEPVGDDVELVPAEPALPLMQVIPYTVKCPHCHNDIELLITDSEISVVPPSPAPPAEEAASEVLPTPEAASPPEEPPPAPAMAQDVFGNPIEGPPEPAPTGTPEEEPV